MTSSARRSNDGGIVNLSALAVLRLTTSSNFVGCSTGRSPGLATLRILSTYSAARRDRASWRGDSSRRAGGRPVWRTPQGPPPVLQICANTTRWPAARRPSLEDGALRRRRGSRDSPPIACLLASYGDC